MFGATAGWRVCVVVGEAEDTELAFDSVEGGTLDAVWIDRGERGGEADAGRLLDKIITLRRKSVTCHILWAIFEVKIMPAMRVACMVAKDRTYGGAAGKGSGGSGSSL